MRPGEKTPQRNKTTKTCGDDAVRSREDGGDTQQIMWDCDETENIKDTTIWSSHHRRGGLRMMPGTNSHRRVEQLGDVVWIDGLINQEPWQDHNYHDWEETIKEVKNFVTGILFLLAIRRILVHLLRTRYRSHSMQ